MRGGNQPLATATSPRATPSCRAPGLSTGARARAAPPGRSARDGRGVGRVARVRACARGEGKTPGVLRAGVPGRGWSGQVYGVPVRSGRDEHTRTYARAAHTVKGYYSPFQKYYFRSNEFDRKLFKIYRSKIYLIENQIVFCYRLILDLTFILMLMYLTYIYYLDSLILI